MASVTKVSPEPSSVSGWVNRVDFVPGRKDGLLGITWNSEVMPPDSLYSREGPDGEKPQITCDGIPVDHLGLLAWLAEHDCNATLYPRIDRYGVSTRAEFTSRKE